MVCDLELSQRCVSAEVCLSSVANLCTWCTRVNVVIRLDVGFNSLLNTLLRQLGGSAFTEWRFSNDPHTMEAVVWVSWLENEATHDSIFCRSFIIESVVSGECTVFWNLDLKRFNETALVIVYNVNLWGKSSVDHVLLSVSISLDVLSKELALDLVTSLIANTCATDIEPLVSIHQKLDCASIESCNLLISQVLNLFVIFIRKQHAEQFDFLKSDAQVADVQGIVFGSFASVGCPTMISSRTLLSSSSRVPSWSRTKRSHVSSLTSKTFKVKFSALTCRSSSHSRTTLWCHWPRPWVHSHSSMIRRESHWSNSAQQSTM